MHLILPTCECYNSFCTIPDTGTGQYHKRNAYQSFKSFWSFMSLLRIEEPLLWNDSKVF